MSPEHSAVVFQIDNLKIFASGDGGSHTYLVVVVIAEGYAEGYKAAESIMTFPEVKALPSML